MMVPHEEALIYIIRGFLARRRQSIGGIANKVVGKRRARFGLRNRVSRNFTFSQHCSRPVDQARLELVATTMDRLEMLQGLHEDLIAVGQSRFANIERLCSELEQHLEDFQRPLEKKPRNSSSRQTLESGKLSCCELYF